MPPPLPRRRKQLPLLLPLPNVQLPLLLPLNVVQMPPPPVELPSPPV